MRESPSRQRFGQIVARAEPAIDLGEAALLVACEEYPGLDVARYLARLDELGARAGEALQRERSLAGKIAALSELLFRGEGFHGNNREYYDPRNSFLNDVLDRRTGMPITLSMVYIEIGRRAGLDVQGVGFPGHFLVKVPHSGGEIVVDPYHGGVRLSETDCQMRLDRVYGAGKVRMEPDLLARVGSRAMLLRLLRNLKAIYSRGLDHERAIRVLDLLLLLDPRSAEDLRDRGLAFAAADCYAPAADDLEAYLELAPGSPDGPPLLKRILELRQRAARLN